MPKRSNQEPRYVPLLQLRRARNATLFRRTHLQLFLNSSSASERWGLVASGHVRLDARDLGLQGRDPRRPAPRSTGGRGPAWRARPADRQACSGRGLPGPTGESLTDAALKSISPGAVADSPLLDDGSGCAAARWRRGIGAGRAAGTSAAPARRGPDQGRRRRHQPSRHPPTRRGLYPPPPGAPDILGLELAGVSSRPAAAPSS